MTFLAEHAVDMPRPVRGPSPQRRKASPRGARCRDPRWPAVAAALVALRRDHRRSVRIVDAECGSGTLLLCAVRRARDLGFTAIEARGIDSAPVAVCRACTAIAGLHDPAIAITFELGDIATALSTEADFPADIVLWHGTRAALEPVVVGAGRMPIADMPAHTGAVA